MTATIAAPAPPPALVTAIQYLAGRIREKYPDWKPRKPLDSRVEIRDECWIWIGATNSEGYGQVRFQDTIHYVHMLAAGTPRQKGIETLHSCDTPACFNPAHLTVGTTSQNQLDSSAKGRKRNQNMGKTHCPQGHEYNTENTYTDKRSRRSCRECQRTSSRQSQRRRRAAKKGA